MTGAGVARLEMRGIAKRFGPTVALAGVDFAVQPGEVHALVGENGAGKSTLMKVLSGALRPDAGTMSLEGQPYTPHNPLDARRRGVVMVYQELALAPHLTVAENILLGVEPARWGVVLRREQRARAAAALEWMGHADVRPDTVAGDLPVSARQLVEIARAVALQCRVLVLDEPTSTLARDDVERLFRLIRRLRDQGIAIVYISHFLEEVQAVADRYTVLRDGASVGGGAMAGATVDGLIRLMVGRQLNELYPRSRRTPGVVILEARGLTGLRKPADASFALRRGEVLGIAGLVGAGRSELARTVFGLDPVRRGQVRVAAYAGPASPARRWASGVGFLSEDRKSEGLALSLSVADNLTLARLDTCGPWGLVFPRRQMAAARDWASRLGLRCRGPAQAVQDLSGGNQQKVALARLLHAGVDVLLLDEPTRGIDVGSKAQIYRLLDELAAAGKAVLLVSSYIPELLGVCDRIAVMYRGRLGPARPVAEWDPRQLLLAATAGESSPTRGAST